ncbi:MAG: hypothetical protein QOE96_1969 [Blastocatellia bacterium]|nr:hypothetical protein [Blastocatellia bacterium]
MRSAQVDREQTKNGALSDRAQKMRPAASSRPSTFNDARPALRLGRIFRLSQAVAPHVQAKLTVNASGDQYEQEADRVAEQVMRMPLTNMHVQRKCGCGGSSAAGESCAQCSEDQPLVQRSATAPTLSETHSPAEPAVPNSVHDVLRSAGQPLDTMTRSFMESRFNQNFGHVRIHTGPRATESAQGVRARAYTVGHDVVFGSGEYAPETMAGRKLLAHELTHVVQQRPGDNGARAGRAMQAEPPPVRQHLPQTTLAGDWIINNPAHKASPTGKTDAELLGDAFSDICRLTQRNNDHITVTSGAPATGNLEGCDCLRVIENDLAAASPAQAGPPHIQMDMQGWSTTRVAPGFPALVAVHHPESNFEWGYWTGGQTRHLKPFWQTVAHEICGHVAAFVRTRGANVGSRGVGMGHNIAIEGENLIAGEHGVAPNEQRGLDMDPTGTPLPGHRGESFLQANILDFDHASSAVPASAGQVVSEAASSVVSVQNLSSTQLFIQVEGFAFANEGGVLMAMARAVNVAAQIEAALNAQRTPLSFSVGSGTSRTTVNRLKPSLANVVPGSSIPLTSSPGRRVQIYLFHQAHSAGP